MAVTAGVAAAFATTGMAVGTGFAAVVLTVTGDRFAGIDVAEARFTSAFDQGCRGHDSNSFEYLNNCSCIYSNI